MKNTAEARRKSALLDAKKRGRAKVESMTADDCVVVTGARPPLSHLDRDLRVLCGAVHTPVMVSSVALTGLSTVVRRMLSSGEGGEVSLLFKEGRQKELFLDLDESIVTLVARFVEEYYTNNTAWVESMRRSHVQGGCGDPEEVWPRVCFHYSLDPSMVLAMAYASSFLHIPPLMDLACRMLAHYHECIEDMTDIGDELMIQILSRLDMVDLCILESRADIKDRGLNTSSLWDGMLTRLNIDGEGAIHDDYSVQGLANSNLQRVVTSGTSKGRCLSHRLQCLLASVAGQATGSKADIALRHFLDSPCMNFVHSVLIPISFSNEEDALSACDILSLLSKTTCRAIVLENLTPVAAPTSDVRCPGGARMDPALLKVALEREGLEVLVLRNMCLADIDCDHIGAALRSGRCPSLHTLDLSHNQISAVGAMWIFNGVYVAAHGEPPVECGQTASLPVGSALTTLVLNHNFVGMCPLDTFEEADESWTHATLPTSNVYTTSDYGLHRLLLTLNQTSICNIGLSDNCIVSYPIPGMESNLLDGACYPDLVLEKMDLSENPLAGQPRATSGMWTNHGSRWRKVIRPDNSSPLDLGFVHLQASATASEATLLSCLPESLISLHLRKCGLTSSHLQEVATSISRCRQLQLLDLGLNPLDNERGFPMKNLAVLRSQSLQRLVMRDSQADNNTVGEISRLLPNLPALKVLDMSSRDTGYLKIKQDMIIRLAQVCHGASLEMLDVSGGQRERDPELEQNLLSSVRRLDGLEVRV